MTWLTTSGGVMMAATKNISTIITLRPLTSHSGRSRPSPVRLTEITGISNTMPKIRNTVIRKLM